MLRSVGDTFQKRVDVTTKIKNGGGRTPSTSSQRGGKRAEQNVRVSLKHRGPPLEGEGA